MPPRHRFNDDPGFIGDQHWDTDLRDEHEMFYAYDLAHEPRVRQHAKDVLLLAASAGMPDTFWWTDSRVQRAIATLDTNVYAARRWAEHHAARSTS